MELVGGTRSASRYGCLAHPLTRHHTSNLSPRSCAAVSPPQPPLPAPSPPQQAITHYKPYLSLCEESGDEVGQGTACFALAQAYQRLDDTSQSQTYLRRFLEAATASGKLAMQAEACCSLGVLYNAQASRHPLTKPSPHRRLSPAARESFCSPGGEKTRVSADLRVLILDPTRRRTTSVPSSTWSASSTWRGSWGTRRCWTRRGRTWASHGATPCCQRINGWSPPIWMPSWPGKTGAFRLWLREGGERVWER